MTCEELPPYPNVMQHYLSKHFFLESNRFFLTKPSQHGFRYGFPATTQLILTSGGFLKTRGKGGQTDAVF